MYPTDVQVKSTKKGLQLRTVRCVWTSLVGTKFEQNYSIRNQKNKTENKKVQMVFGFDSQKVWYMT